MGFIVWREKDSFVQYIGGWGGSPSILKDQSVQDASSIAKITKTNRANLIRAFKIVFSKKKLKNYGNYFLYEPGQQNDDSSSWSCVSKLDRFLSMTLSSIRSSSSISDVLSYPKRMKGSHQNEGWQLYLKEMDSSFEFNETMMRIPPGLARYWLRDNVIPY